MTLTRSLALFVVAAIAEIGGAWLVLSSPWLVRFGGAYPAKSRR